MRVGALPTNLTTTALQSVRANAANNAWEAYSPDSLYQPLDATLTALAAADWAANALPIGSGANTVAQVSFAANTFPARGSSGNLVVKSISDNALSFVAAANYAAMRAALVPMTVGDAVAGGGANRVLYEDGSQNLAADADLTFDGTTLTIDGTSNSKLLVIQGHSTQTANITEWQKSTGVELASVFQDSNGYGAVRLYAGNSPVHGVDIRTDTGDTAFFYAAGTANLANLVAKTAGGNLLHPAFDFTIYHAPKINANFNGAITLQAGEAGGASGSEYVNATIPVSIGVGALPTARLQVRSTTEQFRAEYDASNYLKVTVNSVGAVEYDAVGSGANHRFMDKVSIVGGNLSIAEGLDIEISDGTGTKIGQSDSSIGFWGADPISQPTTSVAAASFTANSGTAVNDASTFDGYTLRQVIKALRLEGLLQ